MNWGTVDLLELIWTVAALPGLVVWVVNLHSARQSLYAVRQAGLRDARAAVARYAVRKSWVMIHLAAVFALIGVISMARPPNPEVPAWDALRVLLTLGLLSAPAVISFIGLDWRRVEHEMLRSARGRLDVPPHNN